MTTRASREWRDRRVGDVVAEDFRRAGVFGRFGIDFCCGGGRTIEEACEARGVEYAAVAAALDALEREPGERNGSDPRTWDPADLARHIVETHHVYVRENLPVLTRYSEKVARVHGARHAELGEIDRLLGELSEELHRHMEAEELDLFPRIEELSATGDEALRDSVRELVDALEGDHDRAGGILRWIRGLSDGFSPPPDACATYRALYASLVDFEGDLHRHVHLENNILFPRVLAADGARAGGAEA